jgi:Ca2+-binding RTX toxin-like protein
MLVNPERLEARRMLSASPSAAARPVRDPGHVVAVQSGGTLTLGNVNSVQIVDDGAGGVTVYDKSRGGSDPAFATTYTGVTALVVEGTKGDDNISADLFNLDTTINAGGGDDFLTVSVGDGLNDSPKGRANVVLYGEAGRDVFAGNNFGTGSFVFNGGGGRDSLSVLPDVGYHVVFNQ